MQPHGGMRARHRGDEEQETKEDGPQGHPIGPAHRAVAWTARRATTVDFDHPGAAPIGDLATDRHRASRRRLRIRSLAKACRRAPRFLCVWHLAVLFLGLTGLADGLAPKERR